jgi:hypothetical protein
VNRFALSVTLIASLASCGEAESREDLESQATSGAVQELPAVQAAVPVATAPPPAPARVIAAGTVLTFEVRENVSTSSHASGDSFSLVLVDAVTGMAGAALRSGAPARGLVIDSRQSTGPDDQALLSVRVSSVELDGAQRAIEGDVQSTAIETSTRDSGTRTAVTIATGAAAGAIIGQVLGQDTRSTVTGAAVGTAVGVVVALTTRDGDATLPEGSRIIVRLNRDLAP